MGNSNLTSYPTLPSNPQNRQKKQQQVRGLLFAVILLLLVVLGLSIFLIGRNLGNAASVAPSSDVLASSFSSNASALESTVTATPTPTAAPTEMLSASANVEVTFGPLPTVDQVKPLVRSEIRAIYLGAAANLDSSIELTKNSEINAFVIDLKESDGVKFNSTNPTAIKLNLVKSYYNLSDVIKKCHDNNIKVIGRIVCFNDPKFASQMPDYSIKDESGNLLQFKNENNNVFTNPYDTRTWDYNIALADEAAQAGIDEIQLDYVRFPTGKTTTGVSPYFGDPATTPTKVEAINRFLQTARILIQDKYGIPVGADVFGITLSSKSDGEYLGQDWATIGLTGIDNLAPMVYPSHYADNTILNGVTLEFPDKQPYDVLYNAFKLGQEAASAPGFATVRPYLQAFTASYLGPGKYTEYGYAEINQQIKAVYDVGYKEWILWNAGAVYPSGKYDGLS